MAGCNLAGRHRYPGWGMPWCGWCLTGVSVAAVALMDLGRGFHEIAGFHTTWVLYAVLWSPHWSSGARYCASRCMAGRASRRGRRVSVRGGRSIDPGIRRNAVAESAPVQHADAFENAEWSSEAVDRSGLVRDKVVLTSAALRWIAAVATYLRRSVTTATLISLLVGRGVVTAGMPVIEWLYARQLRCGGTLGPASRVVLICSSVPSRVVPTGRVVLDLPGLRVVPTRSPPLVPPPGEPMMLSWCARAVRARARVRRRALPAQRRNSSPRS